jgi:hypothetical protein
MGALFAGGQANTARPAPRPEVAEPVRAATPEPGTPRPRPFDAELDASEIDDRDRPGPTWTARARALSRSSLTIRSRRMSYVGRRSIVLVHLIDDQPVPLFGTVRACDYESEGMYTIDLDLAPVPTHPDVQAWILARH